MPDYYFDIETYSKTPKPDLKNDEIIAITYQKIDSRNGEAKDKLNILKSWESSEADILKEFYAVFQPEENWAFVPIGYNLPFDFISLFLRWSKLGIKVGAMYFSEHPYIDIKHIALLCNKGSFKDCKLEKFAGKKHSGDKIIELYDNKAYDTIQSYVEDEAFCFLRWYQSLVQRLPDLWLEFARDAGIIV